jgi:hypothetical protein
MGSKDGEHHNSLPSSHQGFFATPEAMFSDPPVTISIFSRENLGKN